VSAIPGWYPDPGGQPDRYRYWDGTRWSAQLSSDPRAAAPASMDDAGTPDQPRRRAAGLLIGVIALALLVLAAGFIFGRSGGAVPIEGPLPSSTVSGWDDSSPTPGESTPTPTPSARARERACSSGEPDVRDSHPVDGRVYGGNLSFTRVSSFEREAPEARLSFAYDITQQYLTVSENPGWIAQLAVGRLRGVDGFDSGAKRVALTVVECVASSEMYIPYEAKRRDLRSVAFTVDGQPGWLVETDISVTEPGLAIAGDHVIVAVVEDGADWGLFFGAVPIGDRALTSTLKATVADLRAS
jgi:hypothetical protein